MKIVWVPAREQWYIEKNKGWYLVEDEEQVLLSLSVLPLKITDEYHKLNQGVYKGSAEISIVGDLLSASLRNVVGLVVEVVELRIDESCLHDVEWHDPVYDDGWVACKSRLLVENISTLDLKVYTPLISGLQEKEITIEDVSRGTTRCVLVERGRENVINLLSDSSRCQHEFVISCEPEPIDHALDVRELGFVLVDEVVGV